MTAPTIQSADGWSEREAEFERLIRDYAEATTHRDADGMRAGYVALRAFALATPAPAEAGELPLLPEPWNVIDGERWGQNVKVEVFCAQQMCDYARAAIAAGARP